MTDELDALKAALRALPAAQPAAKANDLQLAMENFDRLQESSDPLRPNQDRPQKGGVLTGVRTMLNALKTRPLLAATTSAASLLAGFAIILPLVGQGPLNRDIAPANPPVATAMPAKPEAKPTDALSDMQTTAEARAAPKAVPEPAPMPELARKMAAPASDALPDAKRAIAQTGILSDQSTNAMATAAPVQELMLQPSENTESFANAPANPVRVTAEEPVSTFSIDVDTAAYSTIRSSLNAGVLPDPAAVRIEEMINYFPYDYPKPQAGQAFRPTITVMPTPWNPNTRLVNIAIQGAVPQVVDRPPLNLVFLIDTSGSMNEPNKLPLLKQSLGLMLGQLHAGDQVALVAYAGSAGLVLPPTKATDTARIVAALDNLAAGGATAGADGLALAYQTAESMAGDGEVSRVLLATDGDFNVGIDNPEDLKTLIAQKRKTGVYLSVLGFGRGNLDDATMQALAQNGNGTASYIDTLNEARKVLVDQLSGALYPIADNVKIQVEWNPAQVAEYRLIGYETRALRREDFNNDKIDAGDIGAGAAVTAIYEVTAPGSAALLNDPLRYGKAPAPGDSPELGYLRLRAVAPGATDSSLQETPILPGMPVTNDSRFAAAIAGFGQLLTGATYLGNWNWDQAIELALAARGTDDFGYRIEAVNLMRTAKVLSEN